MNAELKQQQQHLAEVQSLLLEQQQRNDGLQREADLAHIQLQESREAFRVRIQHCMLEVSVSQVVFAVMNTFKGPDLPFPRYT